MQWPKMEDNNVCVEPTLKQNTIVAEKNQIATLNKSQLPNNTGLSVSRVVLAEKKKTKNLV